MTNAKIGTRQTSSCPSHAPMFGRPPMPGLSVFATTLIALDWTPSRTRFAHAPRHTPPADKHWTWNGSAGFEPTPGAMPVVELLQLGGKPDRVTGCTARAMPSRTAFGTTYKNAPLLRLCRPYSREMHAGSTAPIGGLGNGPNLRSGEGLSENIAEVGLARLGVGCSSVLG